jgi:hypothetical protein
MRYERRSTRQRLANTTHAMTMSQAPISRGLLEPISPYHPMMSSETLNTRDLSGQLRAGRRRGRA